MLFSSNWKQSSKAEDSILNFVVIISYEQWGFNIKAFLNYVAYPRSLNLALHDFFSPYNVICMPTQRNKISWHNANLLKTINHKL